MRVRPVSAEYDLRGTAVQHSHELRVGIGVYNYDALKARHPTDSMFELISIRLGHIEPYDDEVCNTR